MELTKFEKNMLILNALSLGIGGWLFGEMTKGTIYSSLLILALGIIFGVLVTKVINAKEKEEQ